MGRSALPTPLQGRPLRRVARRPLWPQPALHPPCVLGSARRPSGHAVPPRPWPTVGSGTLMSRPLLWTPTPRGRVPARSPP
eukprot:11118482-Alexandrium_andersonii.AAC.1